MNSDIQKNRIKLQEHPFWVIIIVFLSVGLYFLYLNIQSPITYGFSPLFDGNEYLKIYHYFKGTSQEYTVSFPYHSRILVPYLASLMPFQNPVNNFHAVNLVFLILSIAMIYGLWREFDFPLDIKLTGFFWLLFHWVGILRHNIFDPVTVDVPIYFFQSLILWLVIRKKFFWLIFIGPVSILDKEIFLALLFLFWFYLLISFRKEGNKTSLVLISIALLLTFLVKILVNTYFPPLQTGRGSIITLLFHAKETIINPFRAVRWITGTFVAFGVYLILAIIRRIRNNKFMENEKILLFISGCYLMMGLLGGGDFTRLVFLGFPFIMTWILMHFTNIHTVYKIAAIITSIPLMKLHKNIPDPAFSGWQKFYNWFPEFAPPLLDILWLLYVTGAFLLIMQLAKRLSVKI